MGYDPKVHTYDTIGAAVSWQAFATQGMPLLPHWRRSKN